MNEPHALRPARHGALVGGNGQNMIDSRDHTVSNGLFSYQDGPVGSTTNGRAFGSWEAPCVRGYRDDGNDKRFGPAGFKLPSHVARVSIDHSPGNVRRSPRHWRSGADGTRQGCARRDELRIMLKLA